MSRSPAEPQIAVLQFWEAAGPDRWFGRSESFDASFRQQFLDAHHAAARREYEDWMDSAEGALALLILLDQFPRNCFRGSAHSYATDGLALHYAKRAVAAGFDRAVAPALRMFFYLPFEHSEDPAEQARSLELHRGLPEAGGRPVGGIALRPHRPLRPLPASQRRPWPRDDRRGTTLSRRGWFRRLAPDSCRRGFSPDRKSPPPEPHPLPVKKNAANAAFLLNVRVRLNTSARCHPRRRPTHRCRR